MVAKRGTLCESPGCQEEKMPRQKEGAAERMRGRRRRTRRSIIWSPPVFVSFVGCVRMGCVLILIHADARTLQLEALKQALNACPAREGTGGQSGPGGHACLAHAPAALVIEAPAEAGRGDVEGVEQSGHEKLVQPIFRVSTGGRLPQGGAAAAGPNSLRSLGDIPHAHWLTVPTVNLPSNAEVGGVQADLWDGEEERIVFVPKSQRDVGQATAGLGGSMTALRLDTANAGMTSAGEGQGGLVKTPSSPAGVGGEGPWAGGAPVVDICGVGGGGAELQALRLSLDRIVEFTTQKEARTDLVKSLLRGGAGAMILAALVTVVGEVGVGAGGCRETALGALVNMSMVKESRTAMFMTHKLGAALLHVLDVAPAASPTLNLTVKLLRNLSDQGGGENRALMLQMGLLSRLVAVVRREGLATPDPSMTESEEISNAAVNTMSNLASHNPSRQKMLATPGVAEVLVEIVHTAEPNSRLLRGALVSLTNLSCHKANREKLMRMGLADLLVTFTLFATPDSKHLEAALIMLVNMSAMQACRQRMVTCGAGEAAVAVIRACQGGAGHSKNHQIALQIIQNLSADAATGEILIQQGGLGVALSSAATDDAKVSAVAAGVLSNLALYGRLNGGKVCRILVAQGALEALQALIPRPERTGLSAAKAAAFLFGVDGAGDLVSGNHELLDACGASLKRLCDALTCTLDGRELYGVTFDVYELVLAVRLTVPAPSTHVHTVKRTCTHARTHDTEIHKNIRCG